MAVCSGRFDSAFLLFRRLHCFRSSPWWPVSGTASSVGSHHRVIFQPCEQAVRLMYKTPVQMSRASASTCTKPKDYSIFCREGMICSSPVDFLEQIDKESLGKCSSNDIASYLVQLGHCHMQSLFKSLPWLEASYHTAFLQLNMTEKLDDVSKCVKQHECFVALCNNLEQSYKECDDEHLAYSLLMLVYLGVPSHDHLIHKLLFELRDRIQTMNIHSLSVLSRSCKALPQLDVITIRKSIHRLRELLQEDKEWTFEEVDNLFVTATKHTRYLTFSGLADRVASFLTEYVHNEEYMSDVKRIGNLVSALRKLSGHISDYACDFLEIAVQIQAASLRNIDRFSYRDFDNICDYLHYFQSLLVLDDFRLKCEKRMLVLLQSASGVRQISNLLRALNMSSSKDVLDEVQSRLYEEMDNMDLYLMSKIAKSFTTIDPERISNKVMGKFQELVAERADLMTGYWTGMQQLIGLFYKRSFLDDEVKDRFVAALMRYLKHVDYRWSETSTVLQVLVTIADYPGLPDPIFESILLGVQRWATPEVYHLINRINRAGFRLTPKFTSQVRELLIVLYSRLLELVPGVPSLYYLAPLANKSIGSHRNHSDVDPVVLEKIMDRIIALSSDRITEHTLGRLTSILFKLQYFSPVLLDNMVKSALNIKTFTLRQTAMSLLAILQRVGYRPEEFDSFTAMMMDCYKQYSCEKKYAEMVSILSYLSSLQYFPVEELNDVFSIDFLECFDKEISDTGKLLYKDRLMILNRNCVLECPELDVPWFHNDYCAKKYEKKWAKKVPELKVRPALEEVLGGAQFYSVNAASPYYYIIDFECILDENNQPVPVHLTKMKHTWQRVAILPLGTGFYCLHSRRLTGATQVQLRHLEILGYKTVMVPHYEWNSMGLADFDAQCEYLHNKIFK